MEKQRLFLYRTLKNRSFKCKWSLTSHEAGQNFLYNLDKFRTSKKNTRGLDLTAGQVTAFRVTKTVL